MRVDRFGPIQTSIQYSGTDADCWNSETLYFFHGTNTWVLSSAFSGADGIEGNTDSRPLTPKQAAEWFLQPEALDWLTRTGPELPSDLMPFLPGASQEKKLLKVYEKGKSGDWRILDITGAESWELENVVLNWDSIEGYPQDWTARTLYRLSNGSFVLLERYEHNEALCTGDYPEFTVASDVEAAELLFESCIDPPSDLAHLVEGRMLDLAGAPSAKSGSPAASVDAATLGKEDPNVTLLKYLADLANLADNLFPPPDPRKFGPVDVDWGNETLIEYPRGRWMLRFLHKDGADASRCDPLNRTEAAKWLLLNGFDVPSDLYDFIPAAVNDGQETPPVTQAAEDTDTAKASDQPCVVEATPSTVEGNLAAVAPQRPGRMTSEQANQKAVELATADRSFVHKTLREWADTIGCSEGLVAKLPFWREVVARTGRAWKGKAPRAVPLNDKVLEATANLDAELERLTNEQARDDKRQKICKRV